MWVPLSSHGPAAGAGSGRARAQRPRTALAVLGSLGAGLAWSPRQRGRPLASASALLCCLDLDEPPVQAGCAPLFFQRVAVSAAAAAPLCGTPRVPAGDREIFLVFLSCFRLELAALHARTALLPLPALLACPPGQLLRAPLRLWHSSVVVPLHLCGRFRPHGGKGLRVGLRVASAVYCLAICSGALVIQVLGKSRYWGGCYDSLPRFSCRQKRLSC